MLVVGLTGGIGTGKTTVAARLRERGVPVFDADAEVHKLYSGAAVPQIEAAFPGTTANRQVDRAKLSAALLLEPTGFKTLESIVHPLVQAAERAFLKQQAAHGAKLAVLEIPLLFEVGLDAKCDRVIVTSANPGVQRARVLERAGMTAEKLGSLLARQLSDAERRSRADFIVDTNGALDQTIAQIATILAKLANQNGTAFARHWQ